ncbi:histone-like nucleoid-structuring protein, MvaT/MvaU family [Modicisalibacter xianhensis]|uniref:MvaT DNA-binding domain-containing protein n=1 Tax=Modicisalibacter xianhensis TaxID=442341 RepID=A0A1I3C6M0_9GAMM|nr:histone-like nucleoid-structuring protein, MvaT/MvaU family [Halomonas xianhensis]SFH70225.1 hypothetical protein SAMN04487959_10831 [Halomonas xianhensis]
MSLLSEYLLKEQQLKELDDELRAMERDTQLQADLAFKTRLDTLMADFDKHTADVVALLESLPEPIPTPTVPTASPDTPAAPSDGRRKRKTRVYENPHTGERIETRSANHKTLKAWKAEHGAETVEAWVLPAES